ncbi:MAG TPA: adenylate/guanylate cyclase domain-containing protein, partial [Polyangiaceae bacterium]|nr:adenylate/guanylate cyclase domain-containing protein [Polyangiaceae bacterium]
WERPKRFGVYRRFLRGPFAWLRMTWELVPASRGGTRLDVKFEAEPSNLFTRPIAWIGAKRAVAAMLDLARGVDRHVREDGANPFALPVAPSDPEAYAGALARLKEADVAGPLADRVGAFVRDRADADVVRIRPFELADAWGEGRREVLSALLRGVPAGLVELRWSIVCPSCRTGSADVERLSEIGVLGHCQMCDIAFELELDRAVEATFRPHPGVRKVPEQLFCAGGPARTPHVLAQVVVPPGGKSDLAAPGRAGRYRVFGRGGARASLDVREGAADHVALRTDGTRFEPPEAAVAPGATVTIENDTGDERHVKLEELAYASAAATAHEVSTLAEFRSLFSSDLLKRETPLKVARVAILFSDLTGSTALYTEVGDAAAFRVVDDHFDVLREVMAEHGGVVVKTMGDAVMASFTDEDACARAAVACLERFERFRRTAKHAERTSLKLGLYGGACYVVTANGVLDYFGQTVNVASRLQHLAEGGEIVLERRAAASLAKDPRVTVSETAAVRVKGVEHPLETVRVRLAETRR